MEKLITKFEATGICEVDVKKVCKAWTDKFQVSQWNNEYSLIKYGRGENRARISISKTQADEIIAKLELLPVQSSIFNNSTIYLTKGKIKSERDRIQKYIPKSITN